MYDLEIGISLENVLTATIVLTSTLVVLEVTLVP